MAQPQVLYVHASADGGVFVVRPDASQGWITQDQLDADLERVAAAGGVAMVSLEGGQDAPPAAHALHRRVILAVNTRLLQEHHPAVTPLPEGVTRVMAFAHAGRTDLLVDVLARGADPNVRDHQGTTPVMYAANNGQAEAVTVLVQAGGDPGLADADGTTALMFAAQKGHLEAVRALLLAGVEVDAEQPEGFTALDLAEGEGHDLVVALLHQAGARR